MFAPPAADPIVYVTCTAGGRGTFSRQKNISLLSPQSLSWFLSPASPFPALRPPLTANYIPTVAVRSRAPTMETQSKRPVDVFKAVPYWSNVLPDCRNNIRPVQVSVRYRCHVPNRLDCGAVANVKFLAHVRPRETPCDLILSATDTFSVDYSVSYSVSYAHSHRLPLFSPRGRFAAKQGLEFGSEREKKEKEKRRKKKKKKSLGPWLPRLDRSLTSSLTRISRVERFFFSVRKQLW